MSRILFLTTAHKHDDDRIFYHQAKSLQSQGNLVKVSSLSSNYVGTIDHIEIEAYPIIDHSNSEKMQKLVDICKAYQPDCIICSEPLAVIAARKYAKQKKTSIIYDVTEWYPSYRMVDVFPKLTQPFHWLKFFIIQLYAGFSSNAFIFGEASKQFPLTFFFPFKKKMLLPYYPDDNYITNSVKALDPNKITLCYTGRISREDGIVNFFNAIEKLQQKTSTKIEILIVGKPKRPSDEQLFLNLINRIPKDLITIKKPVDFRSFSEAFSEADICFDLRDNNKEYTNSLPIKLFYYIASGKPIIYTKLKALAKHMKISDFGYTVNPEDAETIADIVLQYINNPDLYYQHAKSARKAYEEQYNWSAIKDSFNNFVNKAID